MTTSCGTASGNAVMTPAMWRKRKSSVLLHHVARPGAGQEQETVQGEVDPTPQAGVSPMPTAYRPPPRAAKRAAVAQPIMPWAPHTDRRLLARTAHSGRRSSSRGGLRIEPFDSPPSRVVIDRELAVCGPVGLQPGLVAAL